MNKCAIFSKRKDKHGKSFILIERIKIVRGFSDGSFNVWKDIRIFLFASSDFISVVVFSNIFYSI